MTRSSLFTVAILGLLGCRPSDQPTQDFGEVALDPQPNVHGNTPSTSQLLAELAGRRINDRRAEIMLWELARSHKLDNQQRLALMRFVDSNNPAIFSAAAECVAPAGTSEVGELLRRFIRRPDVFRSVRASHLLLTHFNDDSGLRYLESRVADDKVPDTERRQLTARLISIQGRDKEILSIYVSLLTDQNVWVRYNAYNVLRLYTGKRLPFTYRKPTDSDVAQWKQWAQTVPPAWAFDRSRDGRPPSGIGARLNFSKKIPFVTSVRPGFPADQAGLVAGDVVLAIDGDSTEGKSQYELVHYEFTGSPGTPVEFTVLQKSGETKTVNVTRTALVVPAKP